MSDDTHYQKRMLEKWPKHHDVLALNSLQQDTIFSERRVKYIERAKMILPILVRQAQRGELITYQSLASEINLLGKFAPLNINDPLGSIVATFKFIEKEHGIGLPILSSIAVKKGIGEPGDGMRWAFDEGWEHLTPEQKKLKAGEVQREVFAYPYWDSVLTDFCKLSPLDLSGMSKQVERVRVSTMGWGGGESVEHKNFKELVSNNRKWFKVPESYSVEMEYIFPSNDRVDVVFNGEEEVVGVEVKPQNSNEDELIRGIFQCVKYLALFNAVEKTRQKPRNVRVFLCIERDVTETRVIEIANTLSVEYIEKPRFQ